MSKVTEFLDKVMADEAAKAEFEAVIGVRKERELNDGDFQKIVELSEKLGASVTLDKVKDFLSGNGRELSEEELAGVAGGSGVYLEGSFVCPLCGKKIFIDGGLRDCLKNHLILFHPEVDENIAEQKAEELLKTELKRLSS